MLYTEDEATGRVFPSQNIAYVDRLLELKKTKSPWEVVEVIVSKWRDSNPNEWDSFVIEAQEKRESREKESGASKTESLRSLLDIPAEILLTVRVLYGDEIELDSLFFREFGKRFPMFLATRRL